MLTYEEFVEAYRSIAVAPEGSLVGGKRCFAYTEYLSDGNPGGCPKPHLVKEANDSGFVSKVGCSDGGDCWNCWTGMFAYYKEKQKHEGYWEL